MIRNAAWAGRFYPRNDKDIRKMISEFSGEKRKKVKAKAIMVPHAGYIYSGPVAGEVYAGVELPKRFIIISPNHWEGMTSIAVDTSDQWETPLGIVNLDQDLRDDILKHTDKIKQAEPAHRKEHAIEVQIPFIQYHLGNDFQFVPITMLSPGISVLDETAVAIAAAVREAGEDVLLVASTDMSHYISEADAKKLDGMAIEKILALDPQGLYKTVMENGITMCGMQVVYTIMKAAMGLGCVKAELVRYSTSGEASGDYDEVVGYAGVIFS